MENNLKYYDLFAPVPDNAKKTIQAGKLKGKTDINPVWRIKVLTEVFGPVGFGWYTEIAEHWTETAEGESTAWVRVKLYVKDDVTGEWSRPIEGVGGSKQNGKGQGDGINDEAFKMAETDAISVCCKKLGIAASVYWDADKTKYSGITESKPEKGTKTPQKSKYRVTETDYAVGKCKSIIKKLVETYDPIEARLSEKTLKELSDKYDFEPAAWDKVTHEALSKAFTDDLNKEAF